MRKPHLLNGVSNINHFGYDPYNSVRARELANTVVCNFPSLNAKITDRKKFKPLPSLLQTQAE